MIQSFGVGLQLGRGALARVYDMGVMHIAPRIGFCGSIKEVLHPSSNLIKRAEKSLDVILPHAHMLLHASQPFIL